MKKRLVCLILVFSLALGLMPAVMASEATGSFVFAAAKAGQVIVSPTRFDYREGQTVYDVLMNGSHGHSFTEQSSGFINVIDGVEGSFNRCDNRGGYDMEVPADSVDAFFFVSSDLLLTEQTAADFSEMLTAMGDYNEADNGVHAYPAAQSAYTNAENALLGAPADYAALADSLRAAMLDYAQNVLGAEAYTVALTFADTVGAPLTDYTFHADDSYGNQYSFRQGQTISLPDRDYSFRLVSGDRSAFGTMTVSAPSEKKAAAKVTIGGQETGTICIYGGAAWMGEIVLHSASGSVEDNAYPAQGDTFFLPDTASSAFLYIGKGAGLDDTVYTTANVKVFPLYIRTDGVIRTGSDTNEARSWASSYEALTKAIQPGIEGSTVVLEARYAYEGYTLAESRTLNLLRTPTLSDLRLTADGAAQNIGFTPEGEDYTLTVSADTLSVQPVVRDEAYSVTVAGAPAGSSGIAVPLNGSRTEIPVIVTLNGQSKTYTLTVNRVSSVNVTVSHPADTEVCVYNAAGAEIGTTAADTYALAEGERYTCASTKNTYYHASLSFTAEDGKIVTAAQPDTGDWLTAAALRSLTKASAAIVYLDAAEFQTATHEYVLTVPDDQRNLYAAVVPAKGSVTVAETGKSLTAVKESAINTSAKSVSSFLVQGAEAQKLTLRVSETQADGTVLYQDYLFHLYRSVSADDMSLKLDGQKQDFYPAGETYAGFDRESFDYTANVIRASETAVLRITPYSSTYYVRINGQRYDLEEGAETLTVSLPLDHTLDEECFTIEICSEAEHSLPCRYTMTLKKKDAVKTKICITDAYGGKTPESALAAVYDSLSGERIWPDADGSFPLVDTLRYRVVCTAYGYVGQQTAYTAQAGQARLEVALTSVPEQPERPNLGSSWPSFRGSDDANGVVNFNTPITSDTAVLSWASKLGEGYSSSAVSCPILITEDSYEYLIVYSADNIYKVDALSGVTVAQGKMDHSSSFAINSPTYAEGMIFVGLANGTVQAFDAVTLDPLWIYHDPKGGQPNCPITYANGYIYTGFWNSETTAANFVCLSVTDEAPTNENEEKLASWVHTDKGFYWAGAYVDPDGEFLLVGTDDGDPGYLESTARLLCLDPDTGRLLDTIDGIRGDLRSSVSYDSASQRYFFTSKGGYFYSVKMTHSPDGTPQFDDASFRAVYLDNYGNDPGRPPMSTCTPVVYGSRAYIGVSGVGQFTAYSGHNITVIDLNTWTIAYSVPTQGYPQTSGLLTTAYLADSGYVFVYFFDNFTPGKLRVLQDKAGQTKPVVTTPESYSDKGKETIYNTPYVLFTPAGEQEQYAICSPIADAYGTLYFKNDSAYLMALSSTITGMRVTKKPDKTEYKAGEHFDSSGMEIELTYANGLTRTLPASRTVNGVTIRYFEWDERAEGLQTTDTKLNLRFACSMYQNDTDPETGASSAGKPVASPVAGVPITVTEGACISIHKSALPEENCWNLKVGENAQIDLSELFSDAEGHTLIYGFSVTDSAGKAYSNAQTHFAGNTALFTFTGAAADCYTIELFAVCEETRERKSVTITAEVEAAENGLPVQYGYDETPADRVTVFATVSSDGIPLLGNDEDETLISHLEITVPYFDLAAYGLEDYYRYAADENGSYTGSKVIERPTAMHLFIYLIQRYYMGLPETYCGPGGGEGILYQKKPTNPCEAVGTENVLNMLGDVAFQNNGIALSYTGGAQSTYMKNVWGHDENLMYYRNHVYPLQSPGWGSTSDYILLSDGDTIDMAMFTNWDFYQYGSFCTFVDRDSSAEDGVKNSDRTDINHRPETVFTAEVGESKIFSAVKFGTQSVAEGGTDDFTSIAGDTHAETLSVAVYDAEWNEITNSAAITSWVDDGQGHYTVTFAQAGTYYLLGMDGAAGTSDACIAPATAKIVVTEKTEPECLSGDVNGDGKITAQDVQRLRNYLLGKVALTSEQLAAADTNRDGKITAQDVQRLRNYMLGKISSLG